MKRIIRCVLVLIAAGLAGGCGRTSRIEGLVQSGGTVTYDGKPIEAANVIFSPEGEGRSAVGITDSFGRFRLTTAQPNDGAMPGKYIVTVSKLEVENPMSADEAREWFEKNEGPPPSGNTKNRLPEKYSNPKDSGLTAEVAPDGENDFAFPLN